MQLQAGEYFQTGNEGENLHENFNYKGVRLVNFVICRNLIAQSAVFPH
jgi:hypothetical protein